MIKFGDFVYKLRIENSLTLREFCRRCDIDASNWSKIERNILPPPKSKRVLEEIARVLNLKKGSEKYNMLFDLAIVCHIPPDLITNKNIIKNLPVLFRTLRGEKPTREELEGLIGLLKENEA